MTQYTVGSSEWVQITAKGRNGYCWLDFQDDGSKAMDSTSRAAFWEE